MTQSEVSLINSARLLSQTKRGRNVVQWYNTLGSLPYAPHQKKKKKKTKNKTKQNKSLGSLNMDENLSLCLHGSIICMFERIFSDEQRQEGRSMLYSQDQPT